MANAALMYMKPYYLVGGEKVPGANPNLFGATDKIYGDNTNICGHLTITGNTAGLTGDISNVKGHVTGVGAWATHLMGSLTDSVVSPWDGRYSSKLPARMTGYLGGLRGYTELDLDTNVSKIRGAISGVHGVSVNVSGDVSNIVGSVSNLRGDVSNLKGDVSNIRGFISRLRGKVHPTLTGDVSHLWGDLTGLIGPLSTAPLFGVTGTALYGDVSGVKGVLPAYNGLSGLYGDLSGVVGFIPPSLWGNISGLEGEVFGLRGECTNVYGDASGITGNLDLCGLTGLARTGFTGTHILSLVGG